MKIKNNIFKFIEKFISREPKKVVRISDYFIRDGNLLERREVTIKELRVILNDAHLMATVQARKSGVLNKEWSVYGGENNNEIVDFVEKNLIELDLYNVFNQILDAVLFGFVPLKIDWKYSDGSILIDNIKSVEYEKFDIDDNGLWFYLNDEGRRVYELKNKYYIVEHKKSVYSPKGEGVLFRCWNFVKLKYEIIDLWRRFCVKYGMPYMLAKIPFNRQEEEALLIADLLNKLKNDGIAVFYEDISLDKLDFSNANSYMIYKELINFINDEISKIILNETLTMQEKNVGSYAMSKVHYDVLQDLINSDIRLVEQTMNRIIKMLIDVNFTDVIEYPVFRLEEDLKADEVIIDRDIKLMQTGQIRFTSEYFRRRYGLYEDEFQIIEPNSGLGLSIRSSEFASDGKDDDMNNEYLDKFNAKTRALIEYIMSRIEKAESLEEIQNKVLSMLPELDTTEIELLMSEAIKLASGLGLTSGPRV